MSNKIIYQDDTKIILKCSNCDEEIIISPESLPVVQNRTLYKDHSRGYVRFSEDNKQKKLHRELKKDELSKPENAGKVVDHINRNKLDNRLENLRIVSPRANNANSSQILDSSSGLIGVVKSGKKFAAKININNKGRRLGTFTDKYDAALVHDSFINKYLSKDDYTATNLYNGKIPQEVLEKYNINNDDLSTIPFIPTDKRGNNTYEEVFYHKGTKVWMSVVRDENGNQIHIVNSTQITELEAAAAREQFFLDHPDFTRKYSHPNIIWPEEKDGKINIAGIILTRDEMEEKTRGY